ncbi:hypothetical protein BDR03DRAFT_972834 [Suillus americanus]|nr:hypothetical protein BDR03DRAFT_972834 [Suillus americanus]
MWCGASGFGILLPLLIRLLFFLRGEISPKMRSNRLVCAMYFRAAQIPLCSLSKCLTLHLGGPTSKS